MSRVDIESGSSREHVVLVWRGKRRQGRRVMWDKASKESTLSQFLMQIGHCAGEWKDKCLAIERRPCRKGLTAHVICSICATWQVVRSRKNNMHGCSNVESALYICRKQRTAHSGLVVVLHEEEGGTQNFVSAFAQARVRAF